MCYLDLDLDVLFNYTLNVISDAFLGSAFRIWRIVHRQMWMWNGSTTDVVSKNVLFKRALEAAKGQSDK